MAIVGSGGKATLMYRLAGEAVDRGYAVITTSTTHLHPPTSKQTRGFYVTAETPDWPTLVPPVLKTRRHVTVLGARPRPDKLKGLDAEELEKLREVCAPDLLLMKADGARARMFKAPGDHEPVVPAGTTRGVVVATLRAVGIPLDERQVHRPERVGRLTGLGQDEPVTPEVIAGVVSHPEAYRRAFPDGRTAVPVPLLRRRRGKHGPGPANRRGRARLGIRRRLLRGYSAIAGRRWCSACVTWVVSGPGVPSKPR